MAYFCIDVQNSIGFLLCLAVDCCFALFSRVVLLCLACFFIICSNILPSSLLKVDCSIILYYCICYTFSRGQSKIVSKMFKNNPGIHFVLHHPNLPKKNENFNINQTDRKRYVLNYCILALCSHTKSSSL